MKVLLLNNMKYNRVHSRLGTQFLIKLADKCDLTIYGAHPHETKPMIPKKSFDMIKWVSHNKSFCYKEMLNECGPQDVILLHQMNESKALVPGNLKDCKIPKAILFFDTYLEWGGHSVNLTKVEFVRNHKINLVLRRGCRSFYLEKEWNTPSVWLPFSVREETYYTEPSDRYLYGRKNLITFVGSGYESKNKLYPTLKKAIDILKDEGLMVYQGIVGKDDYPNALRTCVAAMSYSFEHYKGHPAKLFEIMGSGTGVITTPFSNKKELFGDEDICWEIDSSCNTLVEIANRILNPKERKDLYYRTRNALKMINKRHLDKHRIEELLDILEALAGGSQIPSIWE